MENTRTLNGKYSNVKNTEVTISIPRRQNDYYLPKEGDSIEIPEADVAVAEMLISDIYRLELDAPGTLIE